MEWGYNSKAINLSPSPSLIRSVQVSNKTAPISSSVTPIWHLAEVTRWSADSSWYNTGQEAVSWRSCQLVSGGPLYLSSPLNLLLFPHTLSLHSPLSFATSIRSLTTIVHAPTYNLLSSWFDTPEILPEPQELNRETVFFQMCTYN